MAASRRRPASAGAGFPPPGVHRRRNLARGWAAASFLLLASCGDHSGSSRARVDRVSGPTMGTVYSIRLGSAVRSRTAAELQRLVAARLEEIEASMSTYRPDSELSRFNASRSTDWFSVSPDTAAVIESALKISRLTGGAFDITVAPLVELWGFGAPEDAVTVPTAPQLQAASAAVGYTHLEVRLDPPALRKAARPALQVDLSGIAKGFAVDALTEVLEARGIASYLVEIGGEVRVGGAKPDGSPWRVGIETPVEGRRSVHRVLELCNTALATSGDYRNFIVLDDGRRYSHFIDPRTGNPVSDRGLGSVSILAPTCQFSDAMATALYVLGPDEGLELAERRKLAALFLVRQGEQFSARVTGSFREQTGEITRWTGN